MGIKEQRARDLQAGHIGACPDQILKVLTALGVPDTQQLPPPYVLTALGDPPGSGSYSDSHL